MEQIFHPARANYQYTSLEIRLEVEQMKRLDILQGTLLRCFDYIH